MLLGPQDLVSHWQYLMSWAMRGATAAEEGVGLEEGVELVEEGPRQVVDWLQT